MRMRDYTPQFRPDPRNQNFIGHLFVSEEVTAFRPKPVSAMAEITRSHLYRIAQLTHAMRELIAQQRAAPSSAAWIQQIHQPSAKADVSDYR
jgi:hypothetical protein